MYGYLTPEQEAWLEGVKKTAKTADNELELMRLQIQMLAEIAVQLKQINRNVQAARED